MTPRQTLILDSSQLSQYFSCAENWNLGSQQNLVAIDKRDPSSTQVPSEAITMGSLGHKYLEIYYLELFRTKSPQQAAAAALAFNPDLADFADNNNYPLDPLNRKKVLERFKDYLMTYPADRDFQVAYKKLPAIFATNDCCNGQWKESLIDSFRYEPLIEKGFSYKLFESYEYLFVLEGRIDFMGYAKDGTLIFMDHKFQLREHLLYERNVQFLNYALATGLNLGVINYIRLHDKVQVKTFVRQPLSFSSLRLYHWKQELIEKYVEIAKAIRTDSFPQNWGSCSGQWGRPCMFTPLCNEYNTSSREAIRQRDFTTKAIWRPW